MVSQFVFTLFNGSDTGLWFVWHDQWSSMWYNHFLLHLRKARGGPVDPISEFDGDSKKFFEIHIQMTMICSDTDFVTGIGVCGWILFGISWLLVFVTLPFSLCVLLKVQWRRFLCMIINKMLPGGARIWKSSHLPTRSTPSWRGKGTWYKAYFVTL